MKRYRQALKQVVCGDLHSGSENSRCGNGREASALILPIDLALATADAVARAIVKDADVALAPDEQRRGTNLLHIGPRALRGFRFAFGIDSLPAHRHWAEQAGFRVATIDDPLLAFDIDRPEDYDRWRRQIN